MKTRNLIVLLIVLLIACTLYAHSNAKMGNYSEHINALNSDTKTLTTKRILSASFAGRDAAWIVPLNGRQLIYTHDGGEHWHKAPDDPVKGFWQTSFVNERAGWATGFQGGVWTTLNKGEKWQPLAKLKPNGVNGFVGSELQFIDHTHGWAVEGRKYFWRTTDGGINWEATSPLNGLSAAIMKLHFITPQNGWLGCEDGILLKTNNGGGHWEKLKANSSETIYGLWFANEKEGWALIGNSVYRSSDGGKSWKPVFLNEQPYESPVLLSIYFLNRQKGWATGYNLGKSAENSATSNPKGVIFHTSDGGETWTELETDILDKVLSQIYYSDINHGWLISTDYVYRTFDGGKTWKLTLSIP